MKPEAISPEQWAGARRKWEADTAFSYASAASLLGCSKQMVGRVALKQGWQKGIAASVASKPTSAAAESKLTEIGRPSPTQAPSGDDKSREKAATVDPSTNRAPANLGQASEMPEGLTEDEQQDWLERAVMDRQRALNRTQATELRAAKSTVYAAIKGAGREGGYDAARTARQVVSALSENHKGEMANELERVRLELGAFQGGRPRAAKIIVHQRAGVSIMGEGNSEAAIEARAAAVDKQALVMEARRIVAEADAEIARKAGWEIVDV